VEIGVHYIAFWCVFGLCGIQPVEILDFCGNTRKNLMKASKRANTTHFPCRHVSTISKHYTFPNQTSQNCVHHIKTLHFPNQTSQNCVHHIKTLHFPNQTSQNCVHHIKTLHFCYTNKPKLRPLFVSTISKHYTFPIQTYKNCVHHLQHHTTCVHYITFPDQTSQNCVHYLQHASTISTTTLFLIKLAKIASTIHNTTLFLMLYDAFAFLYNIHGHRTLKAPHPV
jgi:hypothetical protein